MKQNKEPNLQHKQRNDEKDVIKNPQNKTKLLVDQIISGGLIKGVVELEYLVVQVLGEIHLLLRLMNKQGTFSRHRHHIDLLSVRLWKTPTSKAEAGINFPHSCLFYINIFSIFTISSNIPCLFSGRFRTQTQILRGSIY